MTPYHYYEYGFSSPGMIAFAGAYIAVLLAMAAGSVVINGIAPYKMAKNAGIPRPWLAFIPIAQGYIFGLLAQRSLYFHTGKRTPLAKINLLLPAGLLVCTLLIGVFSAMDAGLLIGLLGLVLCVGSIASMVYLYYTYYYVFKDYAPDNAVLFLILSIIFPVAFLVIMLIHMNVVPVSVAGRSPYGQPKYNRPSGPNGYGGPQGGGYGQGGYGPGEAPGENDHGGPGL